ASRAAARIVINCIHVRRSIGNYHTQWNKLLNRVRGAPHLRGMRIGILGSGTVGQTLASGFLKHGHEVVLGTRDPQKPEVRKWLAANPSGKTGTFQETAKFADLAVLVTLGRVAENAVALAGPANLAGKTLIDATNPLTDRPPQNGVLEFITGP